MLRRADDITHLRAVGVDGDIGRVRDLYFDDDRWVVRYLVVGTGGWLGPDVLLSPVMVSGVDWARHRLRFALTRDEVARGPSINLVRPVSRRDETRYYAYFGFAPYWTDTGIWPQAAAPGIFADEAAATRARAAASLAPPRAPADAEAEAHLHSARAVTGYDIAAADGRIGHFHGFLVDEDSWAIRYLEVTTGHWIGRTAVAVAREALGHVDWPERVVTVGLTRHEIETGPRVDRLEREQERRESPLH
ncbi:MAG: PRC-barrel domain-containing protein [Vicinamibacterales bacterium]